MDKINMAAPYFSEDDRKWIHREIDAILDGALSMGPNVHAFEREFAARVGNRQRGRLHAENVQFVPHDKDRIVEAVRQATFDLEYRKTVSVCSNPYGDGQSSARIAELLASIPLDDKLLIKDITY